ncbi:MarR family winged helix-turn-helix transcriptional regulator [Streptomyces sp. NPDC006385]|uniref:MarR family winged helix-turn-helix transcriptional regulator n=1 Tax=Streptomyces sp. NPDC006385 TaxID=3156761 RepID=UPI0033BEA7B7
MRREHDPEIPSDAVGRQVVEAVENLVALWFSAVEDVRPRLPPRQVRALRAVRRQPTLNVTALAEHLRIGLPTASRLCDRLEAAGLLRRRVQPDDRREIRLEVTAQGQRFLGDVTERLSLHLATAFEGVPPAQRVRLEQMLRAFHEGRLPAEPGSEPGSEQDREHDPDTEPGAEAGGER